MRDQVVSGQYLLLELSLGQQSWPCTVVIVLCESEVLTITKTFFCNYLQVLRRHLKSLPN